VTSFLAISARLRTLLAVIAAVALLASACGDSTSSDSTEVASIADRVFTRGELDNLLPDGDATVPSRIADNVSTWLLTQAIELELGDRGYDITEEDLFQAEQYVQATSDPENPVERGLLLQSFAITLVAGRWSDVAGADIEQPEPPMYLCSSHILVETEEEAAAALERYNQGEEFADLAIELSTGPSGPDGGDLGCNVEGSFVPEYETAAYAGEAGSVVGPVETDFGWHLIYIDSVGPATPEFHPHADRQQIDQLMADLREAQLRALIFDLEQTARDNYGSTVNVDASIGTIDLETFTITPA